MEEILKALIQSNHRRVFFINVDFLKDRLNRKKYDNYDSLIKHKLLDLIRFDMQNDGKVEEIQHKIKNSIEYSLELFIFDREQLTKLITDILEWK